MAGSLRTATIVTADVVGSTELEQAIGDTSYLALIRELRSRAVQVTQALDGIFLSTEGDGIWAAFDAAVDGVTASIRLMQASLRLNRDALLPDGLDLELRIGITTGDVTWNDTRTDCQGLARNVAKRLEAAAEPRTIRCSDSVPFLAGAANHHRFIRIGPCHYKGFEDPIMTWQVDYPSIDEQPLESPIPIDLKSSEEAGFVGRADELEAINQAWQRTLLGAGQVITIRGAAGEGKTALCLQAAQMATAQNAVVLYGHVDEYVSYPYQPVVEAITDLVLRSSDNQALLQTSLGPHAGELALIVPEIHPMLGERTPSHHGDFQTRRYLLFEAVVGLVRTIASVNPVIVMLDDLTWADDQTMAMVMHLVQRITDVPVMVLCAYRPAELTPATTGVLTELERTSHVTSIDLVGLDQHEVGQLLRDQTTISADPALVHDHTGGNPFFVREVIREMLHEPTVTNTSPFDRRGFRAPKAVKDLIADRARRLLPSTGQLLAAASVAGLSWQSDTLRSILGYDPDLFNTALADAQVSDIIRPLPSGHGPLRFGFCHAIIRDAIYEQLALEHRRDIHHTTARVIEADWTRNRDQPSPTSETASLASEIAYHYLAAGSEPAKVIEFSQHAASDASERFAYDVAAEHLTTALGSITESAEVGPELETQLLFQLGVAQRRAGKPVVVNRPDTDQPVDTLLLASERAASEGNGVLSARAVLAGSRGMFTSTGETVQPRLDAIDRALDLLPPTHLLRASLLGTRAVEISFGDEFRQRDDHHEPQPPLELRRQREDSRITTMKALAQQGVDIALEQLGPDPSDSQLGPLIGALSLQLVALWRPADLDKRLAIAAKLRQACQRYDRPQATLNAATAGAQAAMEAGDFELADSYMYTLVQSAAELRQPTVLGYAKLRQAMRLAVEGHFDDSERLARESYQFAVEAGQPDAYAYFMGQIFSLRYHQGRLSEIHEDFEKVAGLFPGIVAFRAAFAMVQSELGGDEKARQALEVIYGPNGCGVPNDLNWMTTTAFATQAASRLGDVELCRRLIDDLLPYRRICVDNASTFFGSVERFLALAWTCTGDIDDARQSFERALDLPGERAPVLHARTELEFAEFLMEHGTDQADHERALRLLGSSLAYAGKHGMREVERRATTSLEQLGGLAVF